MRRRTWLVLAAALAGACHAGQPTSSTPSATPTPATVATPIPLPPPIEAAEVAPTPEPRPRNNPGPNTPPGAPSGNCGNGPTVYVDRPSSGATITGAAQTVSADASAAVRRVEFYYHVDSYSLAYDPPVLIDVVNGPPFRTSWAVPRLCGEARIIAIATDTCGNNRDSDPNAVRIRICRQ
jgi:hypothetical protein